MYYYITYLLNFVTLYVLQSLPWIVLLLMALLYVSQMYMQPSSELKHIPWGLLNCAFNPFPSSFPRLEPAKVVTLSVKQLLFYFSILLVSFCVPRVCVPFPFAVLFPFAISFPFLFFVFYLCSLCCTCSRKAAWIKNCEWSINQYKTKKQRKKRARKNELKKKKKRKKKKAKRSQKIFTYQYHSFECGWEEKQETEASLSSFLFLERLCAQETPEYNQYMHNQYEREKKKETEEGENERTQKWKRRREGKGTEEKEGITLKTFSANCLLTKYMDAATLSDCLHVSIDAATLSLDSLILCSKKIYIWTNVHKKKSKKKRFCDHCSKWEWKNEGRRVRINYYTYI